MENRNSMLYPMMVLAAISVIVFSIVGIAAITGHMPTAFSQKDEAGLVKPQPAGKGSGASPQRTVAGACGACGVVEAVRIVEVKGQGSGAGALTGGVAGAILGNQVGGGSGRTAATILGAGAGAYVGNEVEKNVKRHTVFRITIRMDDGSYRTLSRHSDSGVAVGQRVKVVDGAIVSLS